MGLLEFQQDLPYETSYGLSVSHHVRRNIDRMVYSLGCDARGLGRHSHTAWFGRGFAAVSSFRAPEFHLSDARISLRQLLVGCLL